MCVCVRVYISTCHIFIHSSVHGPLSCFLILATENNAALNIGVHVSFQISVFIFFGYIPNPGVELMDHMVALPLLLPLSWFSRVRLCATPQTAAKQALLSLRFSRQEPWSGLPLPSPMVALVLVSWGTFIMFSAVAASIYIPTNNVLGFPFLHMLTNICYVFTFWW